MLSQAKKVLDSLSDISEMIDLGDLKEKIQIVHKALIPSGKLRVALVGKQFQQLREVLCGLLEKPYFFDKPFNRLNRSVTIKVAHGESELYKIFTEQGDELITTKEIFFERFGVYDLEKELDQFNGYDEMFYGEIYVDAPLLKAMDITLIYSANDFEDYDWFAKFVYIDYIVMVLRADILLSSSEKFFLKERILKEFGVRRCALLINNIDYIEDNDRKEVFHYLDRFLSAMNAVISVYPYSSHGVLSAQIKGEAICKEYQDFLTMIEEELPREALELRKMTIIQTLNNCIKELGEAITRIRRSLEIDKDKIQDTLKTFKDKNQNISNKILTIERKVELFINGSIKSQLIRKIDEFGLVLKEDIKKQIMICEDTLEMKKAITEYLQDTWEQFFKYQEVWLKNRVFDEMTDIVKIIEIDIEEYVQDLDDDIRDIIRSHLDYRYNLQVFISNRREKDSISSLTQLMNLGAIGLLFFSFPWAALTFGSAQILQFAFKDSIKQSQKEALVKAVFEGCDKLKEQILLQVDLQFSHITEGIKQQIQNTYSETLKLILQALHQQEDYLNNSEELVKFLDNIENIMIPELKELINC